MGKAAIFLFLLVLGSFAKAQSPKRDSVAAPLLQVTSGIYSLNGVDQLYSEKMYCGTAPFIGMTLKFNGLHPRHQVELLYAGVRRDLYHLPVELGQIINGNSQLFSEVFHVNYTFYQPIALSRLPFIQLYLTGNLLTFVDWVRSGYFELVSSSVAPGLYVETNLGRHRLWLQGALSLLSVATRKNYATASAQNFEQFNVLQDLRRNLRIMLPGAYHGFQFSARYALPLCKRTNLSLGYALYYVDDTYPRPLTLSSGVYSMGLSYQLSNLKRAHEH